MKRFVAGAVACLMLVAGGLFWWQGYARSEQDRSASANVASPPPKPESLPQGDPDAVGKAPPMPPQARKEDREARRFNRYDRNRDGIISRLEMMSSRAKEFRKLDKDGNNLLSFEEWAARTSDRFAGADGNGDGQLTRAEFATTAPKRSEKAKCKC